MDDVHGSIALVLVHHKVNLLTAPVWIKHWFTLSKTIRNSENLLGSLEGLGLKLKMIAGLSEGSSHDQMILTIY